MPEEHEVLKISNLHSHYGESHVLHGIDLSVSAGEVISLLGRNGSGRSTILKSIIGMISKRKGSVLIRGTETIGMASYKIARLGLGYCPEERFIFSSLTVKENLYLPPNWSEAESMSTEEIFSFFPNLSERMNTFGTKLSGGEQQMLALARILRTGANILLLDEITEGLAPGIIQALGRAIRALKKKGITIILVEQNFAFASTFTDRFYILESGKVVEIIKKDEIVFKKEVLHNYLSI